MYIFSSALLAGVWKKEREGKGASNSAANCNIYILVLNLSFISILKRGEEFIFGPKCPLVTCSFVVKGDGWLTLERVKAAASCTSVHRPPAPLGTPADR